MLETLFARLDMQSNEVKVYLALAELGKSTASMLAKKLELPRSTVYSVLDILLQRGIVSLEQTQEVTYYIANQPDALRRMLRSEKQELEDHLNEKEKAVEELIPQLLPLFKGTHFSIPKLQFFEGTKNVRSMLFEHCGKWQESIASYDFTWWGYQDHQFVETYRDWLDFYWGTMLPQERIWLLSNKSSTERKLKNRVARRTIKAIPNQYQFSSTIWVLGDYVVTIMTRQKPHYGFQLKDAVFAANQRLTFQMMWNLM